MKKEIISIVVPMYNEEGNVKRFLYELKNNLINEYDFEVIIIDDGSTDSTLQHIREATKKDKRVKYLSFTRNFGHQNALKAGFDVAIGKAVITMDGDLQHPPKLIKKMIQIWKKGYKIVYAERRGKTNLPYFKQLSSLIFYKIINLLSDTKLEIGAADFRLVDRVVADEIKNNHEATLFLRGLVAWSGHKAMGISYKQPLRRWGESKYSYSKMLKLALDAITSFSIVPLRMATIIGMVMAMFSGIYGIYAIIMFFVNKSHVIIGWPSVIISILFIGGIQLLILGIIGEYIGKIFIEIKNRPLYVVKEKSL